MRTFQSGSSLKPITPEATSWAEETESHTWVSPQNDSITMPHSSFCRNQSMVFENLYQVTKVGLQGELFWLSWPLAEEPVTQQGHSLWCPLKAEEAGPEWPSAHAPFVLCLSLSLIILLLRWAHANKCSLLNGRVYTPMILSMIDPLVDWTPKRGGAWWVASWKAGVDFSTGAI